MWQWEYRGQLPDNYLDGLSANLEQRTQLWQRTLAHQPEQRVWVAEANRGIAAFAPTLPSRDDDATQLSSYASCAIRLDPESLSRQLM